MLLRGPHGSMDKDLDNKMMWKRYMAEVTDWKEIDPHDETTWPDEGAFFWGLLNTPGKEAVDYCHRQRLASSDELAVNNAWYDRQDATGIAAWCPIKMPEPPKMDKFTVIDDETRGLIRNDELREEKTPKMIGRDWVRTSECLPGDKLARDFGRRLLWFYDSKGVIHQGVYVASGYVHLAFGNYMNIIDAQNILVAWRVVMKPDVGGGYYPINW